MTATAIKIRLPTRRRVSVPGLGFASAMKCVVLYETFADVEETDDLVFERGARCIVTEGDVGAGVNGIQGAQPVGRVAAIDVEWVDAVVQSVVTQVADTIAQS